MAEPTHLAVPVFVATMALEAWILARRGHGYDPADTAASLSGGLGSLAVKAIIKLAWLSGMGWLYDHRVVTLGTGNAGALLLFVLEDLCFYVYHRVSHRVRLFWANHVVHHSSERYTLATALRQSWTAPLMGWIFWAPLALLGFRPEAIALMQAFSLLYQYGLHTETIGRLGPLEWVLNTPSHHRVHHGRNPAYLDQNYGGILIVWDRLFGTFTPEGEPVRYGITKPVGSHHPVWIQLHEFVAIARDLRHAPSRRAAWRAVAGPPT